MPHHKRRPENQTENPVKMTGSSPVKEDKKRDKKFTRAKMADKPRRASIIVACIAKAVGCVSGMVYVVVV